MSSLALPELTAPGGNGERERQLSCGCSTARTLPAAGACRWGHLPGAADAAVLFPDRSMEVG